MIYLEQVQTYARSVVDGQVTTGALERLACERFFRDLARQGTEAFPYVLDERLGARACQFIELLPHIKGEWAKPVYSDGKLSYLKIKLEAWQVFVEFQLFGWVHMTTRLRRFRRSYEEVARKNAKSTRAAGRALYMLAADGEPGAQVYTVATTGEQAREVFDVMRNMSLREPEFLRRFGVTVGKHDITIAEMASSSKPLNSESSTLDGLNVHCAIVDEVHAHKTRGVYDVLNSATGARSQALVCSITTAGSDRAGICYELRTYTVKVLQQVVDDDSWFGIVFTLDDSDLWHDPAVWRKANPNLGVSVKLSDLEAGCRMALAMPSAQSNFLTKHMNVWVNADSAWMSMPAWDRCADPHLTVDQVRHLPVWIPLDLASKVDVAAAPLVFYDEVADHYYVIGRFYLPERAVEQGRNSQYDGWRRAGHLVVTEGDVIDFDRIEDDVRADASTLQVRELPYDPFQATQLASHLLNDGLPMVEYGQTVMRMSEPMKTLEALVLQGKITHNANPMMTWMISNVVCHRDVKDNIYPRKEREENKIDGPVALIMGIGRIIAGKEQIIHSGDLTVV